LAPSFSGIATVYPDLITFNEISLCLSWIRKISREAKVFPSSLILSGVEQWENNCIGSGGFADIYRGSYEGRPVAIKLIRFCNTVKKTEKCQRVFNQTNYLKILMVLIFNVANFSGSASLAAS
jgi:hypothetical protein